MNETENGGPAPIFFVHIMKTAGTSFLFYMRDNIAPALIFPNEKEPIEARLDVYGLRTLPPERKATLRAYVGHFPAFAAEVIGATRTVTLLRDPVERVISMLKQRQRRGPPPPPDAVTPPPARTLEQIYDDAEEQRWVDNVQTRVFAMRAEENPRTFFDPYPLDRTKLEDAKERLASFDVVGLTEDFAGAARAAQEAFGWNPLTEDRRCFAAKEVPIPDRLRERIAEDMQWDREFYDFARALLKERRNGRTGTDRTCGEA